MHATENKELMQRIFDGLATGDPQLFGASLAEDLRWTILGTTPWSKTYRGKLTVLDELLKPLVAQFVGPYSNTAQRFIAEGDYVVVECRGKATTKAGKPYNNTYCWVCRVEDGKLTEVTEYMDTQLTVTVLEAPH